MNSFFGGNKSNTDKGAFKKDAERGAGASAFEEDTLGTAQDDKASGDTVDTETSAPKSEKKTKKSKETKPSAEVKGTPVKPPVPETRPTPKNNQSKESIQAPVLNPVTLDPQVIPFKMSEVPISKNSDLGEYIVKFKLSAEGVSCDECYAILMKAINAKDRDFLFLCIAATNLRASIFRDLPNAGNLANKYNQDNMLIVNSTICMTAFVMMGFILLKSLTGHHKIFTAALKKHGNPVDGGDFDDSKAGKIKRELYHKKFQSQNMGNYIIPPEIVSMMVETIKRPVT